MDLKFEILGYEIKIISNFKSVNCKLRIKNLKQCSFEQKNNIVLSLVDT